jgi:transposase
MSNVSARQQRKRQKAAAVKLYKKGLSCRTVGKAVGVSKSTVSRWQREKVSAKCQTGQTGRQCKLTTVQIKALKEELLKGSLEQGYDTDYWTLSRIGKLIKRLFKVQYGSSAVWYLMKRLGWSKQKPQRLAVQRDEAEIERWRRYVFPQLKKRTSPESQVGFLG